MGRMRFVFMPSLLLLTTFGGTNSGAAAEQCRYAEPAALEPTVDWIDGKIFLPSARNKLKATGIDTLEKLLQLPDEGREILARTLAVVHKIEQSDWIGQANALTGKGKGKETNLKLVRPKAGVRPPFNVSPRVEILLKSQSLGYDTIEKIAAWTVVDLMKVAKELQKGVSIGGSLAKTYQPAVLAAIADAKWLTALWNECRDQSRAVVSFETGKDQPAPGDTLPQLEKCRSLQNLRVRVHGHTDSRVPELPDTNQLLSQRRASAIGNHLADNGFGEGQLCTFGYGNARAKRPGSEAQEDRRVDFHFEDKN